MAPSSPVVLVTGSTGFVGRQVVRSLGESGARVRLVVRAGKQSEFSGNEYIEDVVVTPDLFAETPDWWSRVCEGARIVIHVAWYAEPGEYLQSDKNLDCLAGTLQLAKGCATAGVKRFVGIGTCFEYDFTKERLSVDTPLRPLTPYAGAKAAAFMSLSKWLPTKGVEFAWCRLFYLYGEGEDPRRLVPYLHARLERGEPVELTKGNQIRDFMDVREAGRRIVDVALGDAQGPINICSGTPITIRQLAEQIAEQYGRSDLLQFGARPDNPIEPPCILGIR